MLRSKTKRREKGYTVVEVMMAMSILSIGATGIVALQKATLIGNTQARDLATATAIASQWVELLRADGLRWRTNPAGGDTLPSTYWLNIIGSGNEGVWLHPDFAPFNGVPAGETTSAEADVRGMYTEDANNDVVFCTNIRLTRMGLAPTAVGINTIMEDVVRAEVRVFWLRSHGTNVTETWAGTINGEPLCSEDAGYIAALDTVDAVSRYHFVYATSAILRLD